ncbi:hypothetical protein [Streptomyces sp. CBMA156]|uniref:hypothetical protein n=1 Tax=Streptomyces sp. CBMA156 TaxID=1930280 RepID=UPI001661B96B|nr:hypothetical protein [Streptomyces sp. CBMA156]MBD0669585.1 hypothetical protein [Streptomyces sp. CBMA156]MBD0676789.1 hypothetical protein [Streptomyces sp. CBMA156]
MWRAATRWLAVALAVAILTGAVALAWWLAAERMSAAMGLGPPDGVVVVEECYDVEDGEGNSDGTDCKGRFTPAGASADESRPIVVRGAVKKHRPGTRLSVRLARGKAYEPSTAPAMKFGIGAGLILTLGAVPAGWLLVGAWRGRAPEGESLVVGVVGGMMAVIVLGIVVGLFAVIIVFLS